MENGRDTLTKRLMRRASYPKVEGLPLSFSATTELVEKRGKRLGQRSSRRHDGDE